MITSELRITGHDGGRLEFAHDGADLPGDKKQVYGILFMALRNFVEANPEVTIDHNIVFNRYAQKIHTIESWYKVIEECVHCKEALADSKNPSDNCGSHDKISQLINIVTLPSESI